MVRDAPSDATYAWTARGSTSDTDDLSSTTILKPTFDVPDDIDEPSGADKSYEYTVTLSALGVDDVIEDITVTVLEKPDIYCSISLWSLNSVIEGDSDTQLYQGCEPGWQGAPVGSNYTFAWTARDDTQDTALLSATNIETPIFDIPEAVDEDETYKYTLTVSAENADDFTQDVTVTVRDKYPEVIAVACEDSFYDVDEGDPDFYFDCSASGAPGTDPDYTWSWLPTTNLTDYNTSTPRFAVPNDVDRDTTYTYTVTASAANAEDGTAKVTVTVKDTDIPDPVITCNDPDPVYEGAADFTLDCSVQHEPSGAAYAWTARGDTRDTSLLSATDIASPMFLVPDDVAATTRYEYLLTVSAENAENGTAEVTVTVLNTGALAVSCVDPGSVYEGSADVAFDCTASGAPAGSNYAYVWTARGDTRDTGLLSATDIASPTFYVPDEVTATTTYEYLLTVSAANTESGTARVRVTVLNRSALAVTCADPGSVYEGSDDIAFDCEASGRLRVLPTNTPGQPVAIRRTRRLLIAGTDGPTPTFSVPTTWPRRRGTSTF